MPRCIFTCGNSSVAEVKLPLQRTVDQMRLATSLGDWEAKHGELNPEELAIATKELMRAPKKVGVNRQRSYAR
jgi:hypothetical protein